MTMPRDFPLRSIVKPSDLAGVTNGIIPAALLVDVGRRGSKMHHLAARGWRCLMWHFEQAGYRWDVASIDPRTYQRQCEMFDGRKYPGGRYLPQEMWATWEAAGGKWGKRDNGSIQQYAWQAQDRTYTEQWRRMSQYAMAAIPGTSPHGWALAVDLATQLDDDEPAEGITEDQVRFLMADDLALNCGFAWSTVQEPWHLQWFCGDVVPAFVVAWELRDDTPVDPTDPTSPIIPTDPPTSEEDDMIIVDYGYPGKDSWWTRCVIAGGLISWVQGKAQEWTEPGATAPRKLDELASKHIQVQNDQHFADLLATFKASSACPSTFAGNAGLSAAWAASKAR